MTENDMEVVSNLSFWDKLSGNQKEVLVNNTYVVRYEKGDTVYSADHECIGVLLLKQGELRTYILSEEGKEITLFFTGVGEICILSASCMLKSITFDIHIEAEKDTQVLMINPSMFSKLMEDNPYVELFSLRNATEKFSDIMWALEQILFLSLDKRLAIFLMDENVKLESNTIPYTHGQIAKYVGTAREVITRMLKYFSKEGIVLLNRGSVEIIDKNRLSEIININ